MKNISLLLAGVLMCTLVSARGIVGPVKGTSLVAVTNTTGSTLFKLYYKAEKIGSVKISITDDKNNTIFNEVLTNTDGFVRPYNFEELQEGEYTIRIEDENGKTVEKVNYNGGKVEKLIHIEKLTTEENKYVISIASRKPEDVFIYIFELRYVNTKCLLKK